MSRGPFSVQTCQLDSQLICPPRLDKLAQYFYKKDQSKALQKHNAMLRNVQEVWWYNARFKWVIRMSDYSMVRVLVSGYN